MVIFNSYVSHYQRVSLLSLTSHQYPSSYLPAALVLRISARAGQLAERGRAQGRRDGQQDLSDELMNCHGHRGTKNVCIYTLW